MEATRTRLFILPTDSKKSTMKKILSIAVVLISLSVSAQGNLQFNQVINYSISGAWATSEYTVGTITVPSGKVWKIESSSLNNNNALSGLPTQALGSDGVSSISIGTNTVFGAYNPSNNWLPVWLSAGTYDVVGRTTASGQNMTISFSAIEFNVVP